jgi:hypothetical protein
LGLANLRSDRGELDLLDETTGEVLRTVPAPIAVVSDNGPCFRGATFAEAFTGDDPLLRNVRTRVRSPQTQGKVERFQCATRRPFASPTESGGIGGASLGLLAYLDPKGEGDRSLPGNQRPGPDVRDGALRDPRDMAKAGLPEVQSPEGGSSHPPERHLKPAPALRRVGGMRQLQPSGRERCPVRALKEMSGPPTSRCHV